MARKRVSAAAAEPAAMVPQVQPTQPTIGNGRPLTTGRQVIIFRDDVSDKAVRSAMSNYAGMKNVASAEDFANGAFAAEALDEAEAAYFPQLGICVVDAEPAQVSALTASAADADAAILAIEPEYIAYTRVNPTGPSPFEYLRGYRDAVNHLYDKLVGGGTAEAAGLEAAAFADTAEYTWGLQATRVSTSPYSGAGIKLAVLDTGVDLTHPDFVGRAIVSATFIPNQAVQDLTGHGTHCVGTSCGPQKPAGSRRYGVAYQALIHVGKVLSNQGSGSTGGIVAGIEWALTQGCQIASMSLGADVDQKAQQYEVPIRRALARGMLIVAAAGNNASRAAGDFGFVGPPANADEAMAVAAIDSQLRIANFSARSSPVTGEGGRVNIAGPGVDVYSSWPMPLRYRAINGTSMATPHVSGIAALWAQATGLRGASLWSKLVQTARPLNLPAIDVGSGLVQAPQ